MTPRLPPTSSPGVSPWPEPTREVSASSARWIAMIVAVIMVGLLGLMVWGIGRRAAGTTGEAAVTVRMAPDFVVPMLNGQPQFELAAARGRPVLINFWASWCIPCEEEAGVLERGWKQYRDRVAFIGVNVQDTESNAREFVRRFGVTFPNGRDLSGAISVEYGLSGVPETFFVDREGRLVKKWQGPLDDARLKAYLDELLR